MRRALAKATRILPRQHVHRVPGNGGEAGASTIRGGLVAPSLGEARHRHVLAREAVEHRNRDPRRLLPLLARCHAIEDRRAKAPRVLKIALGRTHQVGGEIGRGQPTGEIVGRAEPLETTPPMLAHGRQKVERHRARTERALELPGFDVVEHACVQRHDTTITGVAQAPASSAPVRSTAPDTCSWAVTAVAGGSLPSVITPHKAVLAGSVTPSCARDRTGGGRWVDVASNVRNPAYQRGLEAPPCAIPEVGGRSVDAERRNWRPVRKQKELISRNFAEPSSGLEPETPSLPKVQRQPVATPGNGFGLFEPFSAAHSPLVATGCAR